MTGKQKRLLRRNLPEGWGMLFARVPGPRSSKVRCLLCGASGYGPSGKTAGSLGFDGHPGQPAPWQLDHIAGHPLQCVACRRPFTGTLAVSSHRTCKLHHDCCREHTTVPEWKNPFRLVAA